MERRSAATVTAPGAARGGEVAPLDGEVVVRYEAVYGATDPAAGTHRLLAAVLDEGIRTLLRHAAGCGVRARRLRREALKWLLDPAPAHMFGFATICDALGIDPIVLRRRVLARMAAQAVEAGRGRADRLSAPPSVCRRLA